MLVQSPSLGHCRFALFTFIHFYQLRYSLIYFFIIISFVYLIFRNNILTGVSSFWCCNYNIALSSLTFLVFTSPFHQLGPLGRVSHGVAMSVCLSVCLFVCLSVCAIGCSFSKNRPFGRFFL